MGKSNRIRTKRADQKAQTLGVKPVKKGMPGWAMTLITVVLAAAILLSVAGIMLNASGVFGRMSNVVKSDNYSIDANMMSYFFNNTFQNFVSSYSSMLDDGKGSGNISLNPHTDLKKQTFGGTTAGKTYLDELYCGEFEGTWYDYFMSATVETVKSYLVYCEYAKENNITLTEEDMAEIDSTISMYETYAALYGYPTVSNFLAAQYGEGVSESDVRDCMELTLLADKAMNDIADKIDASVTEKDITDRYNSDKKDYNLVDYTYYTFSVNYDEIAAEVVGKDKPTDAEIAAKKNEILDAYKKAIADAKAEAEVLKGKTELKDFQDYIYNKVANERYDDLYDKNITDKIKLPTLEEGVNVKEFFHDKIIADVLKEIAEDKEETTDVVTIPTTKEGEEPAKLTAYDVEVSEDFAKVLNTVKKGIFTSVLSTKNSNNVEKKNFVENDSSKFSDWAFNADRKVGDINLIALYDGSNADEEVTNKQGKSQVTVYFLTKTEYRDDELSKNFSYMVFSSEATAKEAIKAITDGKTFTAEALKKISEDKKASIFKSVTNYEKGQFGVSDFDKWLFDEATTKGSITATPIKYTDSSTSTTSYIVALYESDGDALWYLDVKSNISLERAEAKGKEITEKYAVTVNESAYGMVKVTY